MRSGDDYTRKLIEHHPIQLIHFVGNAAVSNLYYQYQLQLPENSDQEHKIVHEREHYPMLDLISRFIVAAKLRYDALRAESNDYLLEFASTSEQADLLANQLMALRVPPVDGEQVAGVVTDYYRLIERNFPDFATFKGKSLNS